MKAQHPQPGERARTGRRVLIVDDYASFRSCTRELLESEGYDVVGEAADGESAVALAAELEPELVVLDIQLPDIDGFTVAEQMLVNDPRLQIVLVSSRDRSSYGPVIEASGARGFLSKGDVSGAALEELLE
jgi:DNA-binding NarL/FixJ family response regulator